MKNIRQSITEVLEAQYPDYNVDSFDIVSDDKFPDIFVAENIHLIGKTKMSADGKWNGQPVPLIITNELVNIS